MRNGELKVYKVKIVSIVYGFILMFFIAGWYIPIVASFALFITIPIIIFGDSFGLLRFIPDGYYTETDLLVFFGKIAFGFSVVISLAEAVFKRRFIISAKTKIKWLGSLLFVGYSMVFVLLAFKTELTLGEALFFAGLFFIASFVATIVVSLFSAYSNFLGSAVDAVSYSVTKTNSQKEKYFVK